MEKDIDVSASELQKGAESIHEILDTLHREGQGQVHLITFNFNNQTSWLKVDLTNLNDVHVTYFNPTHRSLALPLKAVVEDFLSRYPKGNLFDWDRHNRLEYSSHQTPYPNAISKEFVQQAPRIKEGDYQYLSVVATSQVKKQVEAVPPMGAPSRFGFTLFGGRPASSPGVDQDDKHKLKK